MKGTLTDRTKVLPAAALAAMLVTLGGCASTTELNNLRSELDAVKAEAAAAKADAAAASQAAAEARTMAGEALGTANAAKAQSAETETRIDRMFKKAMYK